MIDLHDLTEGQQVMYVSSILLLSVNGFMCIREMTRTGCFEAVVPLSVIEIALYSFLSVST